MKIRFWGVRGTMVCPGAETVAFGGNTACVELRIGNRLIIIDAGSGIRPLGNHLLRHDLPAGPIHGDIFLTHTHLDHIIGFPSFDPLYVSGTRLRIYGPVTHEEDCLEKILGDLFRYRYWPVPRNELAAEMDFRQLGEGRLDLGNGIRVRTKYLNHPVLCLGYRFESEGKVVCTAYDTEPFYNIFATDPQAFGYDAQAAREGEQVAHQENQRILDFFEGADLLIHDAQYVDHEYLTAKRGWGHSSYEHAIESAIQAGVKKLVLFHHDPLRTDRQLAELENTYRRRYSQNAGLDILIAREGMAFEL